ncbi:MAG: hypothetical protein Ct9H90mP7_2320 [Candidatus Neomarinimicrobiota bacterium]|nr:MAG: hypothetical protein Ct9H90mP7_2320 [Candidatus Neomarinimicrobiota bacterium]
MIKDFTLLQKILKVNATNHTFAFTIRSTIQRIETDKASLEDVFLKLTGKGINYELDRV